MYGLLVASRPLFNLVGLAMYGLGVALGAGAYQPRLLFLGALIVLMIHTFGHFVNEAEDVDTDDRTEPTFFSGGSRAIQDGLVTARQLRRAAAVISLMIILLIAVVAASGDLMSAVLFAGMLVFGYSYSRAPLMLERRGLGQIATGIVMGLLEPVAGGLAAGGITLALCTVLPLVFVHTVFAAICAAYPDIDADRTTGKWTIPALLGPRKTAFALVAMAVAAIPAAFCVSPSLTMVDGRFISALVVAMTATLIAILIATGRAASRPVLVPMLGQSAFVMSLVILVIGGTRPIG